MLSPVVILQFFDTFFIYYDSIYPITSILSLYNKFQMKISEIIGISSLDFHLPSTYIFIFTDPF